MSIGKSKMIPASQISNLASEDASYQYAKVRLGAASGGFGYIRCEKIEGDSIDESGESPVIYVVPVVESDGTIRCRMGFNQFKYYNIEELQIQIKETLYKDGIDIYEKNPGVEKSESTEIPVEKEYNYRLIEMELNESHTFILNVVKVPYKTDESVELPLENTDGSVFVMHFDDIDLLAEYVLDQYSPEQLSTPLTITDVPQVEIDESISAKNMVKLFNATMAKSQQKLSVATSNNALPNKHSKKLPVRQHYSKGSDDLCLLSSINSVASEYDM